MRVFAGDTVTFSQFLDSQTYKMNSIIFGGLVPDPGLLAHFVEHGLILYAVQKITNRTYAIRGIVAEMDVYNLGADSKNFKNMMQSNKMKEKNR
jgi:hypothetical protein